MIYLATCAGKQHKASEDAVLIGHNILYESSETFEMLEKGFICLADGVGGNHGGAQASHFVLNALANAGDFHEDQLRAIMNEINDSLIEFAQDDPAAASMATTLTGIFVSENQRLLIHIGNTRAYVKQGNYLKQITSDHTTYNWLKSTGQLEAAESCNKNEITNCFGGGDRNLLSKLYISELQPFSLMMLTSDGVHEYVDIDTLEDILVRDISGEEKCQEILAKAMDNGSNDDISVVIIDSIE